MGILAQNGLRKIGKTLRFIFVLELPGIMSGW